MESDSSPGYSNKVSQPIDLEKAADYLADLLAQTLEVQELIRLAQDLKADPDVYRISLGIKDIKAAEGDNKQAILDDLLRQRESLPVVKEYRQAEMAARELFRSIDQIISQAAGLNFAENARANLELMRR